MQVSGKVQADLTVKASVVRATWPDPTIAPYESWAIFTDPYVVEGGFPVSPPLWASVKTVTSLEGAYVDRNRPFPKEIVTGSDLRFLAEDWESDAGVWRPSSGGGAQFDSNIATRPRVREVTYITGKEVLNRHAVRISGGNFAYISLPGWTFNEGTLSFALGLNASNSTYPIFDYYNQNNPTMDPSTRTALLVSDKIDYLWKGTGGSVDPINSMSKARPIYVTVTYGQEQVTGYVSYSPKHNFSTSEPVFHRGDDVPMDFALGHSHLGPQPADFDVFEVNIFTDELSQDEVQTLHAGYMSIYGVGNDWS